MCWLLVKTIMRQSREKAYFSSTLKISVHDWLPWCLRPVAAHHSKSARQSQTAPMQGAKERRRKELGSYSPLQEHLPKDLKASIMSHLLDTPGSKLYHRDLGACKLQLEMS